MENQNRQVLLKRRPIGMPTTADFAIIDAPVPDPAEGEVLVRGIYLSLDPYMRGRISAARSYAKPVEVGAVMEGRVVGKVVRSRDPAFRPGDHVFGGSGWQLFSVVPGKGLLKLDPAEAPLSTALGVLGMPGLTAYVGLSEIGRPEPGETVVVSAASGAVGAVVGQLAKRAGARIVGIAGGPDKCRFVESELGFDMAIDHRIADLGAALDHACPNGIDVYWENVGGAVQQAVFARLNDFGRMVLCGMVSEYNDVEPRPGPNLMAAVRKRLKIQGFIVSDQWQRWGEYRAMAAPLVKSGEIRYREDIVDGLDRTPEAFIGLLQGRNFGKLLVRLGPDFDPPGGVMADINLTQEEADVLVAMEKHRANEDRSDFPMRGEALTLLLQSADKREQFLLDLSRGRIDLLKVKMQNRARQVVVLVRLDLSGAPHRNPDDTEIAAPHIHIYREGFGDKWAMPLPADRFRNPAEVWTTFEDFLRFCNITHPPYVDRGLFP